MSRSKRKTREGIWYATHSMDGTRWEIFVSKDEDAYLEGSVYLKLRRMGMIPNRNRRAKSGTKQRPAPGTWMQNEREAAQVRAICAFASDKPDDIDHLEVCLLVWKDVQHWDPERMRASEQRIAKYLNSILPRIVAKQKELEA